MSLWLKSWVVRHVKQVVPEVQRMSLHLRSSFSFPPCGWRIIGDENCGFERMCEVSGTPSLLLKRRVHATVKQPEKCDSYETKVYEYLCWCDLWILDDNRDVYNRRVIHSFGARFSVWSLDSWSWQEDTLLRKTILKELSNRVQRRRWMLNCWK